MCSRARTGLGVELLQRAAVDVLEGFDVRHGDVFVHLVDGGIGWAELDHLWADLRDEAAVTCATGGRQHGIQTDLGQDGGSHGVHQRAGWREERPAAQCPVEIEVRARVQPVALQKIEHALLKIDQGTFGICEECDEPISLKRLQARPEAQLCIQCKEAQEKEEAVYAEE